MGHTIKYWCDNCGRECEHTELISIVASEPLWVYEVCQTCFKNKKNKFKRYTKKDEKWKINQNVQ